MIGELSISNFRGFQRLDVGGLGRVNLLVGTNNCGKTSILEAVLLLASQNDTTIWQAASRRGERLFENADPRRRHEVDLCHLFHGREIEIGSEFRIEARSLGASEFFQARVIAQAADRTLFDQDRADQTLFDEEPEEMGQRRRWEIQLDWNAEAGKSIRLPLSNGGGVSSDAVRRSGLSGSDTSHPVRYVSSAGLTVTNVVSMFQDIVLTTEEEAVVRALRAIDPTIERLATVGDERRVSIPGDRGGIVVRCSGTKQRIPIGSMGDGTWRMLGLALALATAKEGILLVDEIDTGLHFTVMEDMWKVVDEASRRLGVQVFATTHSRDCYESLAAISREGVSTGGEVSIQRIDPGKSKAIAFTEQEIVAAADRGTEVR